MSIQFKSIVELRAMLDEKSISTSELIQESFELAKKYKELNCFITMNEKSGTKKANAIDQNEKGSSWLSGIPIAQKDLFCTEGLRTTCSSKILSNFIPPYTATAVQKLEDAGSKLIVLECIGLATSKKITKSLNIPTIGIGSSKYCDGQILVSDDLIGLNPMNAKFIKKYANIRKEITRAVSNYTNDVRNKKFPLKKHSY